MVPTGSDPFLLETEKAALPFGVAHLSLMLMKYRSQLRQALPLFDFRGDPVGRLHLEVFPSDSFGKPLGADQGTISQPTSLLGEKIHFVFRVKKVSDAPGRKKVCVRLPHFP